MGKEFYDRPCKRCNEMYEPDSKGGVICSNCNKITQKVKEKKLMRKKLNKNKEKWKVIYYEKKQQLDKIRDNITLQNYKILSEALKIGRKIWGTNFTIVTLSNDMDIPYTTVKRCLSLNRANKKSWKLVEEGKLSVFKLAMICALKSITYQDEIVKIVVEENLSTYAIKGIYIDSIEDVNKERHRLAVEKGYSRKSSAYHNFNNWIDRGKLFLLMNTENLPDSKIESIKQGLKDLDNRIKTYLELLT